MAATHAHTSIGQHTEARTTCAHARRDCHRQPAQSIRPLLSPSTTSRRRTTPARATEAAHPDDNINIVAFSRFSQALLARTSCPVTVNKIIVNLRQDGVRFSAETLYKYMHYLQEAYMLFSVEFFSKSEKIRSQNYRKVYAVDWALADAIVPAEGVDPTRQFENLIYLELRRRGYDVSYYRTRQGYELDFVAVRKRGQSTTRELYQVCYALDKPDVRQRELRAIRQAAAYLKPDRSCIITFNSEETIDIDGVTVDVVPAWKWLLP